MSAKLQIRPTVPPDVPGIHHLIAGIYAEFGFCLDLEGVDRILVDPGTWCRDRSGEFWVLADGDRICGTIGVLLTADSAELKALYVHRDIRRGGWGRRLTELAMDFAARAGRPSIFLWTDTRFTEAHRFYETLGFRHGGEVRELHDAFNSREYRFCRLLHKTTSDA